MYAGYLRLQTHTQNSNNYGFSTAITVTRTRLNVTLCVHSLSCLYWFSGPLILEIIIYSRKLSKLGRGKYSPPPPPHKNLYTASGEQSTSNLDGTELLSMG